MSRGSRLGGRLEATPRGGLVFLASVLVGILGVADVVTGAELSSSVFYVLPVGMAAWYAGNRSGIGLSILAAAVWYAADTVAGARYTTAWIPVWNAGVRLAFFLLIAQLLVRLRAALETQRTLAEIDALTQLANSRRFLAVVRTELARSSRYRRPLSLAYIDLDGFKGINDRWGHEVGDEVLATVGRTLREQVRATDLAARLGGDEFAILFPETDAGAARDAAEKLQASLQRSMDARGWPVGFSAGVFTSSGGIEDAESLLRRADDLMYEAKRAGKGRITFLAGDTPP